jgi:hypothetical protein
MANENTVAIEFTSDGSAAIAGNNAVEAGVNASVDRMNKGSKDSAAAQGKVWEQATQDRITQILRLQDENNRVVQRMATEWNAYKSAGVSASNDVAQGMDKGSTSVDAMVSKLKALAAEALGVFSAFKLLEAGKDAAMFAANVEQADRALSVIANNMGRTSAEAMKYRDSVRDLGITTNSATNATAQFMRAGLPMEQLNVLARAAQGAAISYTMMTGEVISSSAALDKMVRAIVTGNVMELHTLGINVLLKDALRENRQETGMMASAVDSHQRHLLLLNAALEQSQPLLDLYTNSMDLASKKISSSKRPIEELKLGLGQLFLPELTTGATAFYDLVSGGMLMMRRHSDEMATAKRLIGEFSQGLLIGTGLLGGYAAAVFIATAMTGGLASVTVFVTGLLATMQMNLSLTGAEAIVTGAKVGMMGDMVATSSTVATIGLKSIKVGLGVLSAFMIGWEFGKLLNDRFESVRNVGTEVIWGLIRGWNELGFEAQKAMAHMDPTTSHAQTELVIADIERQRAAWLETWRATKAEQLKDNVAVPGTAAAKPFVDNTAAIAAGKAALAEQLRKEQEMRDQAAAKAEEKERKRQADISQIIAEIRERDLLIGKDKDQKELIQMDLKQLKETNALKAHHATQAQLDEAAGLQRRERADMVAQQTLDQKKKQAAAAAEIARKSFEEQSAWLQKLDDFQLKTGQISDTTALTNKFNRERELLELKQKEIDGQIALETHEKKRLELVGQRKTLQAQINHSYVEEGQQLAQNVVKEESLLFAHQQRMNEVTAAGVEARLHFIGQEQGALTAHYAWKREQLNAQYAEDIQSLQLSQAQKLEKERQYQQQSLQLEQERAQKQADLWFSNAQKYGGVMQQMTTMGVQLLLADESQRSQIGKRMLATAIRFGAQELQQFMFNKAKENLLAAASAGSKSLVEGAAATTNLGILESLSAAWAAYYGAMAMDPFGGEAYIPAAVAMTAVAGIAVPAAMGVVGATAATGATANFAAAAAWMAGGILVGALGEGVASSIEGNGSSSSTGTTNTATGSTSTSSTTTTAVAATPTAAPAPIVNIHLYGINYGVDADKLARDIYPAIRRAANDGVR